MHVNPPAFVVLVALGISFLLGLSPLPIEPAAGQEGLVLPDPTWQRLGLAESPTAASGRGVGVVLIDDGDLHPALRPLGERLKHVSVARDMSVSLVEPLKEYQDRADAEYSHGVSALLQMASAPYQIRDRTYGGLAPGATYFVIPYLETVSGEGSGRRYQIDPRLDRALEWVVENRERWNIRVILLAYGFSWPPPSPVNESGEFGLLKNTSEYLLPHSLQKVIKAGILVVNGNGNTSTENNLPPVDFLSVGAYQDSGRADPRFHRENADEPSGRNSDGHERPDLLAPKYLVPNHRTPAGEVAYFGGTSSASAQVAALFALLYAQFPQADAQTIKYALIQSGNRLPDSRRPGVRVDAARAIRLLTEGSVRPTWPQVSPPVKVAEPSASLGSKDAVERALAVSAIAWHPEVFRLRDGELPRHLFWRLLHDDSPTVRKAAAAALSRPESHDERRRLWDILHREADMGVRGVLANVLLADARDDPLDDWICLVTDPNWTARWCASRVLRDHHPAAPALEYALFPEEIDVKARPVLDWYNKGKPIR